MRRLKIYCQCTHIKKLLPKSGDSITELGMMTAMSRFADVYYSGTFFDPSKPDGGLVDYPESIIKRMKQRKYDVYYARNNREVFLEFPNDAVSLWMAGPVDDECYKKATAIVTFTKTWKNWLMEGRAILKLPAKYLARGVPNVIVSHQVLSSNFKPMQHTKRTGRIRKQIGGGFIIGHTGSMHRSQRPHAFLALLPWLRKHYPKVKFLVSSPPGGAGKRFRLPKSPSIVRWSFNREEAPYVISACDLVLIERRAQGSMFAGCLKTIEAAACGVPVLLGYSPAREEVLGEDYPFFLSIFHLGAMEETAREAEIERQSIEMRGKLKMIMRRPGLRREVGLQLVENSRFYTAGQCAKRLKKALNSLVAGVKS